MQPSWWDIHENTQSSPRQNTQTELPVSSSIPSSNNGTSSEQHTDGQKASGGKDKQASATAAEPAAKSLQDFTSAMQASGPWTDLTASGNKRPPPRYEHAANIVGRTLYIVGGNCSKPFTD